MGTKWNNLINRASDLLLKKKKLLYGIAFVIAGLISYYNYYSVRYMWLSMRLIMHIVVMSLLFGIGISTIFKYIFSKKVDAWDCVKADFYEEWKQRRKRYKNNIFLFLVLFIIIAIFMDYLVAFTESTATIIIVLVVFFFLQHVIDTILDQKLNLWIDSTAEINKVKVQQALEIEKKSLEKMSRSDQLRIDLITNVSHDLKTPVTSMVGYIELMKKEELSDVMRDYVDVLSDKTEKLKEMINSLFSLAKASSGNVELHMEKFEVNRLIEQIMADMKDKIDESELKFITQLSKENTELLSDNMYFYRICQNLIENALKYSLKGSRVFIKTFFKENNNLCLEITNTAGYEMDFEKEDILERFTRGDKARTTEGNGLGLAIVSTYAKALGGEFDVKIDCDQFKAYLEFPRGKALV